MDDPVDTARRVYEAATIALPASVLAGIGFLSHALMSPQKNPNAVQIIGGTLFAGFVAWAGCMLLMSMGMSGNMAAPVSAILGASGQRGFDYFLSKSTGVH